MSLAGKTVVLGVTGSIAAYKAVEVARGLKKAGARVLTVLTKSATKFVGEVTFSGITGERVYLDMWDASFRGEMHIVLSEAADVIAIVPATADVIARLSQGRADDLLTALFLSARSRVLIAPAMHPRMWDHPATKKNVEALTAMGRVDFIGPVLGEVASGDRGVGRMEEPSTIVAAIERACGPSDLAGKHVVVTAGPTHEAWDPVRYLGNRSSGKMGFSVAERAYARGAKVTLVAGPVSLATPAGVTRVDVESAKNMQDALDRIFGPDLVGADALVMAAAVADYRPSTPHQMKIKKSSLEGPPPSMNVDTIPNVIVPMVMLSENQDILALLGARRSLTAGTRPVLVGFALETGSDEDVLAYARKKRREKQVDFVVANRADESLGRADARVHIVTEATTESFPALDKSRVADLILDGVVRALS